MHRNQWPDLPPELVHEISSRLHDPTDFVRFHAICKPWRRSHEPTSAWKMTTTDQFLPWLLAPNEDYEDSLKIRCIFSKSSYLAPSPIPGTAKNWVANADGTAVCYFTLNSPNGPTLCDPLSGTSLKHLPFFRDGQWDWEEENPSGIIYNDSTLLLYTKYDSSDFQTAEVRAALLRPGDNEWTVVKRTLESPNYGEFCVAYHADKILITVERSLWQVIPLTTTPSTASDDFLVLRPSSLPLDHEGCFYEYSHVLESRCELLWASVQISVDYPEEYKEGVGGLVRALSVWVHALEEAPALQWVRKKGASLADRVLFLGWPNSFAVDASQLGMTGGFVYFMYDNDKGWRVPHKRRGVFRYNLLDNTTEFVEWLPKGWDNEMCTWLIPQPVIAPIRHGPSNNMI